MPTIPVEVVTTRTVYITRGEYHLIRDLGEQHRITMIKFIRNQYDSHLKEAKELVDSVLSKQALENSFSPKFSHTKVPGTSTLGELLRQNLGD